MPRLNSNVRRHKDRMMAADRFNPGSYYDAFSWGLRSFPPQVLIENFRAIFDMELGKRRRTWIGHLEQSRKSYRQEGDLEGFKMVCYDEERLREIAELQQLSYELMFLGLYRFIELERNRVVIEYYPTLDPKRLSHVRYLYDQLPFLRDCYGTAAIEELRLLCNCIKHAGRVTHQLAQHSHDWRFGTKLKHLDKAFDRIAPFVSAYWVDLTQSIRDHAGGSTP